MFFQKLREKSLNKRAKKELLTKKRFNFLWDQTNKQVHMVDVHDMVLYGDIHADPNVDDGSSRAMFMASFVSNITPAQAALFYHQSLNEMYRPLIDAKLHLMMKPDQQIEQNLDDYIAEIVGETWKGIQEKIKKDKILQQVDEMRETGDGAEN